MKPIPRVCCPRCGGVGQVTLPAKLVRILEFLHIGNEADAAMVHAALNVVEPEPVKLTAINNRLEALRSMELVTRRRVGKHQFYSAALTHQDP